jgi:hypothetical protein
MVDWDPPWDVIQFLNVRLKFEMDYHFLIYLSDKLNI